MTPRRIAVKIFATDAEAEIDSEPLIPLFHRMIQESALDGLLVDVADYRHVPNGPAVILVGHDVEYAIDGVGGRTGLLVTAKRNGSLEAGDLLRLTLRRAIAAAAAIEADASSGISFALDAVKVDFLDRLLTPNTDEGFAAAKAAAEPILKDLYGGSGEIERVHTGDPRESCALVAKTAEAVGAASLLDRIGGAPVAAAAAAAAAPDIEANRQTEWDVLVEDLKRLRDEGADVVVVDVREQQEYEICNLGGELIPLGSLPDRIDELDQSAHIVVHCHLGPRSARAVQFLRDAGFENAWNLQGGIRAWIQRIDQSLQDY